MANPDSSSLPHALARLSKPQNFPVKVIRDIDYFVLRSDFRSVEVAHFRPHTGTDAHPAKHKLNIHLPVDSTGTLIDTNLPVVMHIHGGGWKRGDRNLEFYGAPFMANAWARRCGFIGVAISYRLASKHPTSITDVATAIKWCYDNIAAYGGNKSCFFISGHSAGGHLASLVSLDSTYLKALGVPPEFIKGTMALSGIYTLASPLDGGANGWANWVFRKVYVNASFGTTSQEWDIASPIKYVVNKTGDSATTTQSPTSGGAAATSVVSPDLAPARKRSITASSESIEKEEEDLAASVEEEKEDIRESSMPSLFSFDIAETSGVSSDHTNTSTLLVESKKHASSSTTASASSTKSTVPPFLVINAAIDLGLQFDGNLFFQTLQDNGHDAEYFIVPHTNHATVTRSDATVDRCRTFLTRLISAQIKATEAK